MHHYKCENSMETKMWMRKYWLNFWLYSQYDFFISRDLFLTVYRKILPFFLRLNDQVIAWIVFQQDSFLTEISVSENIIFLSGVFRLGWKNFTNIFDTLKVAPRPHGAELIALDQWLLLHLEKQEKYSLSLLYTHIQRIKKENDIIE